MPSIAPNPLSDRVTLTVQLQDFFGKNIQECHHCHDGLFSLAVCLVKFDAFRTSGELQLV